jgi:hypothetical protein
VPIQKDTGLVGASPLAAQTCTLQALSGLNKTKHIFRDSQFQLGHQ